MIRACAPFLSGFAIFALMTQAPLAQTSEPLPPFPPLPQPQMPSLPGEPQVGKPIIIRRQGDTAFLFCGPIGVKARMLGQLDSLPLRIVQLNLMNTNSVAIISERITVHGFGTATRNGSSPAIKQAYSKTLEIERDVTVDPGHLAPVNSYNVRN